ncbi:MAG: SAM-dependent DNA methyltransferase, partial [Candidatus Aminicenantes bacterium]|nr:SAM-dependent DNA methyltransferase [Candidatus Aminicenantes bacterium]
MKKKSKISTRSSKMPGPFGTDVYKTERSAVAVLMHWMREIIKDNNLDLGLPDVETSAKDRKMPDLVVYESIRSSHVLCVIEAKLPYFDVFAEAELKEPARRKAVERKARYFALTNFKKLVWYNTEKVNAVKPEEEQVIGKYELSEIENLNEMENTRHKEAIKKELQNFLIRLYRVHTGSEEEPKLPVDELLVFRIHEKIRVLANYYQRIIDDKCHKDLAFANKLQQWFSDQGWSFAYQSGDYARAARQTAYLLVNKILFYNLLQAKRPAELDPLKLPESLTRGTSLQGFLQVFFDRVLEIDYETIYSTDFIDEIAFPDAVEVVKIIKELIKILERYDFSKLGFDIIGGIFERLIPQKERHNLGQYFTNADVVDLILKFSIQHEEDRILDPSCGAGTFLVRAYHNKKLLNQRQNHEKLLQNIWGNDIAKFPAHLATINLAINDLSVEKNYPNILHQDFFTFQVGAEGFDPEKWRKSRAKTLGLDEMELIYPRWFDVIVGNPPYTRQEEISEISPKDLEYKQKIIENALTFHGEKIADIGKRAGIYAYFFIHGCKFLKEGGYFSFIVPNSWLDVDYGKGL